MKAKKVPRFFCARNRTQIIPAHLYYSYRNRRSRMGYNAAKFADEEILHNVFYDNRLCDPYCRLFILQ